MDNDQTQASLLGAGKVSKTPVENALVTKKRKKHLKQNRVSYVQHSKASVFFIALQRFITVDMHTYSARLD